MYNTSMNILFSTTYYAPYVSGLTIHVQRIAEALKKRGFNVEVLTSQFDKKLKELDRINGVTTIRIPYFLKIGKAVFMPGYLLRALFMIRKADNVVISIPQFEGFIAALLGKLFGKRVICLYVCELGRSGNIFEKTAKIIVDFCGLITVLFSDEVVTLSEDFAKSSATLKFFRKKVRFVYPLMEKIDSDEKFLNTLIKDIDYRYKIGVVGRISSEKGIDTLVRAIPALKKNLGDDFIILFVGPKLSFGESEYKKEIFQLLNKNKRNIKFLGYLKSKELAAFYTFIDVLVFPSTGLPEVFGIVQAESMLSGTPVVASDLPGVRVPIKITKMGELAIPNDPVNLAGKINKVLKNKNLYLNSKVAEKEFNFEKTVDEYVRILGS